MIELSSCPFCGRNAEMYTGRVFPPKLSMHCTEAEALQTLSELSEKGTVSSYVIYEVDRRRSRNNRTKKFRLRVVFQAFVPRCTNVKCIARTSIAFLSEAEAAVAWNGDKHG